VDLSTLRKSEAGVHHPTTRSSTNVTSELDAAAIGGCGELGADEGTALGTDEGTALGTDDGAALNVALGADVTVTVGAGDALGGPGRSPPAVLRRSSFAGVFAAIFGAA
jgi:hypothetical protein